jgi:hypothetical protein
VSPIECRRGFPTSRPWQVTPNAVSVSAIWSHPPIYWTRNLKSPVYTAIKKRWTKEVAGSLLLWAAEAEPAWDNPPWAWIGGIMQRVPVDTSEAPEYDAKGYPPFRALSDYAAKKDVEETVRNTIAICDYAHRLGQSEWQSAGMSDQEWMDALQRFVRTGEWSA